MASTKKNIQKWIVALRSGEYKQTRRALQASAGFCCLGVACDIFIKNPYLNDQGFISGGVPDDQTKAPGWLVDINYDFKDRTGYLLTSINDVGILVVDDFGSCDSVYLDFDEIADLLQLVYIEKALQ